VSGLVSIAAQTFAGVKTFAALIIASAGIQVAMLFNTNGTGASDVVVRAGTSQSDGSTHSSAHLFSIFTGIGGTEVERAFFTKGGLTFWGAGASALKWDAGGGNSWQIEATPATGVLRFGNNTVRYMALRFADGYTETAYGFEVNPTGSAAVIKLWGSTNAGRVDQLGTDSTGTPGSRTGGNAINRPTGKSAIASGQTTCQIDNSLVSTGSRVSVTFHGDHGAARWWVVVGSGSFTVTLSAAASGNTSFSWQVSNLL
jgi:hypothetical protein